MCIQKVFLGSVHKVIANDHTGLMGEMSDSSFPSAPKLRAIMNLAETESPRSTWRGAWQTLILPKPVAKT